MKKELIQQKVKSVSNVKIIVNTVFIFILSFSTIQAQVSSDIGELSEVQYEFLNIVFGENLNKNGKIYYQPQNSKSWINDFIGFKSHNGIGTCLFDETSFSEVIEKLQSREFALSAFDKEKMPKGLRIKKQSKKAKGLHISEPIIINNYSFIFIWSTGYSAVEVYHYEPKGNWMFKCFTVLSGKL
jgi:hypothetical protein